MFRRIPLLILAALFLFPLGSVPTGCGTCVGNPECVPERASVIPNEGGASPGDFVSIDFSGPIVQYQAAVGAKECGAFTEKNSLEQVEVGRACIRSALTACTPTRYLLNQMVSSSAHFVSFVGVEATADPDVCRLRVHTASSDPARFLGEDEKTCSSVTPDEVLELACGIGT